MIICSHRQEKLARARPHPLFDHVTKSLLSALDPLRGARDTQYQLIGFRQHAQFDVLWSTVQPSPKEGDILVENLWSCHVPFSHRSSWRRIVADLERSLPLGDAQFDVCLAPLVGHGQNNIALFLKECARILKKDCPFVGCFFGGDTLSELRGALAETELKYRGGVSPHVFPTIHVEDAVRLLQMSGYGSPVLEARTVVVWYTDLALLFQDLKVTGERNTLKGRRDTPPLRCFFEHLPHHYPQDPVKGFPVTLEIFYITAWK